MQNGTEMYRDEIGRQVAGRKIELIVEDTEGNTATALTRARKLVDGDKAVGGKVEDREALLQALRRVELKDAPRGPISVDRWGNPIQTIYVRKVERVGGKLQNTVIATFPAVSQFSKYNPEEYLKLPLYTREYPPCKAC